jgi:hypothetical protein
MGSGRIKRKYKKGNLKPLKVLVYSNGLSGDPEFVRPISSVEKNKFRTYFSEYQFEGVKIKRGDKVVWNWHSPDIERIPKKITGIFKDSNVKFYDDYSSQIDKINEDTIWIQFEDSREETYRTRDGRWVRDKRPINFESYFLHVNLEFKVIK